MTGRHGVRAPRRRTGLDLATLPRRAAAQAGPLALVAVLVAVVVALAAAVPRAVARVSDAAVRTAVARAGTDADLVLFTATPFIETGSGYDDSAELARQAAASVGSGLDQLLGGVLRAPVVSTSSASLGLATEEEATADTGTPRGETALRLVWTPVEGAVEWTSGTEPGAAADAGASDPDASDPDAGDPDAGDPDAGDPDASGADASGADPAGSGADGVAGADDLAAPTSEEPPAPVQVALSEAVAAAVGAAAGDPLHLTAADGSPVEAVVAGVFRPVDPEDARWHDVPGLLAAQVSRVGPATTTTAAALLSDASLAAAIGALGPREVQRTVRVPFVPDRVDVAAADRALAALPAAQASPGTLGPGASGGALYSSVVGVLRGALAEIASARAAATALVVGGVAVGALLLGLTAGLLARRRAAELATRRTRGATLPALAAELGAEAVLVVALGAAAGLLLARAVVPGPVPVAAVLGVGCVAAVALPFAALRLVREAADPGRAGAGVRGAVREAGARRLAAELALLALAAASVVVLRSGAGAGPTAGSAADPGAGPDLLAAAAPALLAGVAAVLVARALPALVRRLGPLAERSRRAVPVLAVARARSDGVAPLPLVAVAAAAALVVVGASCVGAVREGQDAAAWAQVGGDVRVTGAPDPGLDPAAVGWGGAPGVTAAAAARVVRDVQARTADGSARVDVVAGAPADLAALADAVAAAAPGAARGSGAAGTPVRGEVVLRWDGTERTMHALGLAVPRPSAGQDDDRPVVAVDVAELGGASAVAPTTVWLVGPGAEAAVRATPPPGDADVTARSAVVAALRADVLPRALVGAAATSVALLLAFVVLAVLVAASAGGPARRRALDTLRTVGLTDREARQVAAGEVLPAALLASAAGAVLGWALPPVVLAPLGLAGPDGASGAGLVAWPAAALPVLAGLVAAAAVLVVEHARRRTHRLGEVLRTTG